MPDYYGRFLNDNIRTEHLKCESCRTQIFLTRIERPNKVLEVRTFQCPHCTRTRTLHINCPEAYRSRTEQACADERSSY